jgi:triacylglycerol lipase
MNSFLIKLCITLCDQTYTTSSFYFENRNQCLYFAFSGTSNLKDIAYDLTFCKKVIPYDNNSTDIRVHGGFLTKYKNEFRYMCHTKIKENDNIKDIVITGHSLGGAIATLCAVDLQYNFNNKNITCVTFGSPRVGNQAFTDSYIKRVPDTYRIVNGNDLITHLPFKFLDYIHVCEGIIIGKYQEIPSFKNHNIKEYESTIFSGGDL